MPSVSKELKREIEELPVVELQKLVIELAGKNKQNHDYINVRYLSKGSAEEDLYEATTEFISSEISQVWMGRGVVQKNIAKYISKCISEINHYTKTTKNKPNEARLLLNLIDNVIEGFENELGTCWTVYDSKLAITVKRLVNLVSNKLHSDYFIEFEKPINRCLSILHQRSNFLDIVYNLPNKIEK